MAVLIKVINRSAQSIEVKDYFNDKMIYMEEQYKDYVVELYIKFNDLGYDLFAIVYDETSKSFKHIKYADQDTYLPNNAWIDASEEIIELYKSEQFKKEKKYLQEILSSDRTNYKGCVFKVIKGTDPPIGTTGFCIWSGLKYGRIRLGIKDKNEKVFWVDLKKCEIYNE